MRHGRELEPLAAARYAEQFPEVELIEPSGLYRDRDNPVLLGTPDRLVYDPESGKLVRGLECKAHSAYMASRFGPEWTDDVPRSHFIQCQWYMRRLGVDSWHLGAFIGHHFGVWTLEAHERLQRSLEEYCLDWWTRYVVTETPPPPDHSPEPLKAVREIWPESTSDLIEASDEVTELAQRLRTLKESLKTMGEREEELKAAIAFAIGDAAGVEGPFGKILYKSHERNRVSWKKIAADYRELLETLAGEHGLDLPALDAIMESHTSKQTVRPFRPYWIDEE